MNANAKKKKYRKIKKVMSSGHTRLLFNIGSTENIFPGTVKYDQNSEESDGKKKTLFSNLARAKTPKMEAGEV